MTEKRGEGIRAQDTKGLKLLGNDVAVIPIEDPAMSPSGLLHIPEEARQRADHGVVKYRGAEVKELRVGDHVFFSGYTGTKITVVGEGPLIILPDEAVLAVLPDEVSHWLTRETVLHLIDEVEGEIESRHLSDDVHKGIDIIRTKIKNYDIEKGLEF